MTVRLPRAPGEPIVPEPAPKADKPTMAAVSDQPLIAALDIGSSKVSALIVTRDADGRLRVLGTGQRESRGVKRGYVTDMEASEFAVREAVEQAERMSGVTIDDVWASYGAGGLVSDVANVEVELGGHQVEQSDIDELLAAGARGDRPQRPGRAPRPPGALHHRRRRGRAVTRSGFMPTGSASTSTSSPPIRRRCATSTMSSARRTSACGRSSPRRSRPRSPA